MTHNTASKRTKFNTIGLSDRIGKSSIVFSDNFLEKDVRLIEVTEEILNYLENGESLSIVGSLDTSSSGNDAVLTSDEKTFSIKKVETSNAVYLVDPSIADKYDIQSASQDYFELKLIPARIEVIKELLSSSQYNGLDAEKENCINESKLLSYSELRKQVQASNGEYSKALFAAGVIELKGKMRILSKIAIREAIQQLIYTIMEHTWDVNNIDEEKCVHAMPDIDPVLINFSLKTLQTTSTNRPDRLKEDTTWALDQNTISKATAHVLFNSQTQPTMPWECEDFLRTWESETPGIKTPDESLILNGIAIKIETKRHKSLSTDGNESTFSFRYLPSEELSLDIQTRLGQLFAIRPKYLEQELEPYFIDMIGGTGKPKNIAEFLFLHTRLLDGFYMPKIV